MFKVFNGAASPGLLFPFLLFIAVRAFAGEVTLAWDPVNSPALVGYIVYYGPTAGNYTTSIDVGNTTTYAVSNLVEGATYHFAVTDYDASHTQSGFSNDVSATIPYSAPIAQFSAGSSVNVALAANGGVASASSTYSAAGYSFAVSSVNDGERAGLNWGHGGGWNDSTANTYPDWVQIIFNGAKTIDHVVVYTLQDNYASPVQPTDTLTFSQYGVTAFTVQGSNGGGTWVTLGTITGNNLVKRTVNFTAASYDRIRINVTAALASYSRITEIEAWGTSAGPPPQSNVALAANGGVASASSTYSAAGYSFAVSGVNDGERAGLNWGHGSGWNDSTANSYPDWVQITFNSAKTIGHVVVYTLQDNYANPVEPTDTLTFTQYGVTGFTVQGWTGSSWTTLATVSGNNLVKRTVNFNAYTTSRIRINVTAALASYSRITEIEAWGN